MIASMANTEESSIPLISRSPLKFPSISPGSESPLYLTGIDQDSRKYEKPLTIIEQNTESYSSRIKSKRISDDSTPFTTTTTTTVFVSPIENSSDSRNYSNSKIIPSPNSAGCVTKFKNVQFKPQKMQSTSSLSKVKKDTQNKPGNFKTKRSLFSKHKRHSKSLTSIVPSSEQELIFIDFMEESKNRSKNFKGSKNKENEKSNLKFKENQNKNNNKNMRERFFHTRHNSCNTLDLYSTSRSKARSESLSSVSSLSFHDSPYYSDDIPINEYQNRHSSLSPPVEDFSEFNGKFNQYNLSPTHYSRKHSFLENISLQVRDSQKPKLFITVSESGRAIIGNENISPRHGTETSFSNNLNKFNHNYKPDSHSIAGSLKQEFEESQASIHNGKDLDHIVPLSVNRISSFDSNLNNYSKGLLISPITPTFSNDPRSDSISLTDPAVLEGCMNVHSNSNSISFSPSDVPNFLGHHTNCCISKRPPLSRGSSTSRSYGSSRRDVNNKARMKPKFPPKYIAVDSSHGTRNNSYDEDSTSSNHIYMNEFQLQMRSPSNGFNGYFSETEVPYAHTQQEVNLQPKKEMKNFTTTPTAENHTFGTSLNYQNDFDIQHNPLDSITDIDPSRLFPSTPIETTSLSANYELNTLEDSNLNGTFFNGLHDTSHIDYMGPIQYGYEDNEYGSFTSYP